jgi:hypothetical protein
VPPSNELVHLVWIGGRLSLLEQLTLKLYQRVGLTPCLWSYDSLEGVPAGVVHRDASEIMPRSSLFTFESDRSFEPGAGKGSYSHWSDQFQLFVLAKFGGWYSQLDVTCLQLPDPTPIAYFFPLSYTLAHGDADPVRQRLVYGLQTCVMRLPSDCRFAWKAAAELAIRINKETCRTIGWFDSMFIITQCAIQEDLTKFIADKSTVIDTAMPDYMLGMKTPPSGIHFMHWCNVSSARYKNEPIPGSFYYKLLESVELV